MTRTGLALAIVSMVATTTIAIAAFQDGNGYKITRHSIDGGGIMRSSGNGFELSGTIGQPDAGMLTGDGFELSGGFWFPTPLGDCEDDGDVDLNDFSGLEVCLDGPDVGPPSIECQCFDTDRSGTIDLVDYATVQQTFSGQ